MAEKSSMDLQESSPRGLQFIRSILAIAFELDVIDRNFVEQEDRTMTTEKILAVLDTACTFLTRVDKASRNGKLLDPAYLVAELICRRYPLFKESMQNFLLLLFKEDEQPLPVPIEKIAQQFYAAKWDEIYRAELTLAIRQRIDSYVKRVCSEGDHSEYMLPTLRAWLTNHLAPLASIFIAESSADRLTEHLYSAYAKLRGDELYDIIVDFPDSMPSILELREALSSGQNVSIIAKSFRSTIKRRLLHLGATTSQILDMYVAMIRSLRILDPSDVFLDFVTQPVRAYLLNRKDPIRCIVSSLIGSADSELHGELKKGGSLEYGADPDNEDGGPGENWLPKKKIKDLEQTSPSPSGQDVLAMLVSIYGSTDLFVNEYRAILAEKLSTNVTFVSDSEVANLELLKIRFGEESLHNCEVMLHDLEESKRVNNSVSSFLSQAADAALSTSVQSHVPLDCLIVSDFYWPPLQADHFVHHPQAQDAISAYEKAYSVLKKPRKLVGLPQLGSVDVDLEFDDGSTRHFSVNPVQATFIMHVAERKRMSSSELSLLCEIEEEEIIEQMAFWQKKGVVHVTIEDVGMNELGSQTKIYEVIEYQQANAMADSNDAGGTESELTDRLSAASEKQHKATLLEIEKYVLGILAINDSMTLERIFTMVKLAELLNHIDMNMVGMRKFLSGMVDVEKIDFVDNFYRARQKL